MSNSSSVSGSTNFEILDDYDFLATPPSSPESGLFASYFTSFPAKNLKLGRPAIKLEGLEENETEEEIERLDHFLCQLFALLGDLTQEKNLYMVLDFLKRDISFPSHILNELKGAYEENLRKTEYLLKGKKTPIEEAERIVEALQNGQSQLIPCLGQVLHPENPYIIEGSHALGVRFSLDADPDFVICSIFNSGRGLREYHEAMPLPQGKEESQQKYDLEYVVRVPKKELTAERILPLITYTVGLDQVYQITESVPGKEVIKYKDKQEKLKREPKPQAHQKGPNCGVEWIFAYLRSQMSDKEYYQMRAALCDWAFSEGLKRPRTLARIEKNDEIRTRLAYKRARAEVYQQVGDVTAGLVTRSVRDALIAERVQTHLTKINLEIEQAKLSI